MQLYKAAALILFTIATLLGPSSAIAEPISCQVVLDTTSQTEPKKTLFTPVVHYLRSGFLTKSQNPLQTETIEELLRRNIFYEPVYRAALDIQKTEHKDLLFHFLNSSRGSSLPEHYWEAIKKVENPYQKFLLVKLITLKKNISDDSLDALMSCQSAEVFQKQMEILELEKVHDEKNQEKLIQATLLDPNRINFELQAFEKSLSLAGLDVKRLTLIKRLHRRYFKDTNVRRLAQLVSESKDFRWEDELVETHITTFGSRGRFTINIPSLYNTPGKDRYDDKPSNFLNISTGKMLYGLFLGAAIYREKNSNVVDVQLVAQNIVNKKLVETLKEFGFYEQTDPATSEYSEYYALTGKFLALSLYSTSHRSELNELYKELVIRRLRSFKFATEPWTTIPAEQFSIYTLQAVKVLTENRFDIYQRQALLLKLSNSHQISALILAVENKLSRERFDIMLQKIIETVHDEADVENIRKESKI